MSTNDSTFVDEGRLDKVLVGEDVADASSSTRDKILLMLEKT